MKNIKKDFPIFKNNPGLVYLDNASTTQKPSYVIDSMKFFLENDYANIHRGAYSLSERSEALFEASKIKVKELIGARYNSEITYTYNSTYAINFLTTSLRRSGMLKKGDKVLVSLVEHHANIVPWLILKEEIGIEIDYVNITADYDLDYEDLNNKLTTDVKVISLTYVSNITGSKFDLDRASKMIKEKDPSILFVVDGSQAVPNFKVDVQKLDCDFMFFTGHKIMADTGIGVLYGKKELLKNMKQAFGGGGAINWVEKQEYSPAGLPFKFEPGTPNIIGAVSLLKSIEYIDSIGGYKTIEENENKLISRALQRYEKIKDKVILIGNSSNEGRIGIFTFSIEGVHFQDVAEFMASKNICIRAGHHCTEPFIKYCNLTGAFRASFYIYNDIEDVDLYFDALEEYLKLNQE